LTRDKTGILHAYLIVGNEYFDSDGYMDKHGGGNIEEWVSSDNGDTWEKMRELTPDQTIYPGWKYNNIQPVTKPDGSAMDGMLLFYGWKDKNAPEAKAFLLIEGTVTTNLKGTSLTWLPDLPEEDMYLYPLITEYGIIPRKIKQEQ